MDKERLLAQLQKQERGVPKEVARSTFNRHVRKGVEKATERIEAGFAIGARRRARLALGAEVERRVHAEVARKMQIRKPQE